MTEAEWKKAFHRLCIIADYSNTITRPDGVGADGHDWCSDSPKFDVEANARAILDNEQVLLWNDSNRDSWPVKKVLEVQ